jgi:hypothetical protein
MLELYCNESVANRHIHQITIDMLDNCVVNLVLVEIERSSQVSSVNYNITNILEVINKDFMSDISILIELKEILSQLELAFNLLENK